MSMKIAIIGACAVGVTTAHALSKAGCDVHVFEQGSSAAQGASFAHSGLLGQSSSAMPFFTPLFAKHWALALLGRPKSIHWTALSSSGDYLLAVKAAWLTRRKKYQATVSELQGLAAYSAQVAAQTLSEQSMSFEQSSGLMVLHSQTAQFEAASVQAMALNVAITVSEQKIKICSPEQAREFQVALAEQAEFVGAIVYPEEAFGNCALFTKQLKLQHQNQGVHYWFNTQVTRLESHQQQWTVLSQSKPTSFPDEDHVAALDAKPSHNERFDAIVVAAGAGSAGLLSPLGLRFPLLKTHAYAVTVPCHARMDAPNCSVLDAATGNTIAPIGNRLRISGQHQLGKFSKPASRAFKALGDTVQQWFPYASKVSEASYDSSTSCVAIDSKPIVGRTQLPGLWVNFAHGPAHWGLSFACAQAIADAMVQRADAFDLSPFSPNRFV